VAGGGAGAFSTGVAHWGQTLESSGMDAPHLKQNMLKPRSWIQCKFAGESNSFVNKRQSLLIGGKFLLEIISQES
jgi:hypothetical protein